MSGKRRRDYVGIFKTIRELLEGDINLKSIVLDFEAAAWKAAEEIFPLVQLRGCAFHWAQCVWRRLQVVNINTITYLFHKIIGIAFSISSLIALFYDILRNYYLFLAMSIALCRSIISGAKYLINLPHIMKCINNLYQFHNSVKITTSDKILQLYVICHKY